MSARRFGTQSLVRLLGNWQETSSRTPLWRQLAEALRLLILDGRLTLQTRLPGERELAAASSDIGVAAANRYPRLALIGNLTRDKSGFPIGAEIADALKQDLRSGWLIDKIQLPQNTGGSKMTATEVRRQIQFLVLLEQLVVQVVQLGHM